MFRIENELGWKILTENKLRFFFSIVGIGASIAIIFINQGFQDGLLRQVKAYLLKSGAEIYVSQEGVDSFMFGSSALSTNLKAQLLKTNGIAEVTDVVTTPFVFDHNNEKNPAIIIGYDANKNFGGPWKLKSGEFLKKEPRYKKIETGKIVPLFSEKQVKPKEAILDFNLAQKHGLNVGDAVEIQDYDFEIVGLSEETTSWLVSPIFMSRENVKNILKKNKDATSYYLITIKDGFSPLGVKNKIISRSADTRRISDRISGIEVLTAREFAKKDESFMREFFVSMLGIVTFLTYVIGILIIGLVIYILTLEKTRDYAILKAVGATNKQVFRIVLLQTFVSAAFGFVLGLLIAKGFEYLTTSLISTQFIVVVEQKFIWIVLAGIFLMSLVASIIPLKKVFTVEPTIVFRTKQN